MNKGSIYLSIYQMYWLRKTKVSIHHIYVSICWWYKSNNRTKGFLPAALGLFWLVLHVLLLFQIQISGVVCVECVRCGICHRKMKFGHLMKSKWKWLFSGGAQSVASLHQRSATTLFYFCEHLLPNRSVPGCCWRQIFSLGIWRVWLQAAPVTSHL